MSNVINDVIKRIRDARTEEEARKILLDNILLINDTPEVALIMGNLKEGPNDDYFESNSEYDENYFLKLDKEFYRRDLLAKPDYINWIIKYTEKRNPFYDDDCNLTKVENNDKIQMEKLNKFVGLISDYAIDNNIESIQNEFGCSYRIKYKDTGLEVGVMHGNGSCCYAQRIPLGDDYIDFSYVMVKTRAKDMALRFMDKLNNDEFEKEIDQNPGEPFIPTKENIEKELEKFGKVINSDLFNMVVGDKPKALSLKDETKK